MNPVEFSIVYVKNIPKQLEEKKIYISREFGIAVHLCACGCGERTIMDIKPHWKNGWDMIEEADGTVTFRPSVGNFAGQVPYHAHYFITKSIATFV